MPAKALEELISLCHEYNVLVSTGGFIEHVLTQGSATVDSYIEECKEFGFDIIEISSGFITMPSEDTLRLVEKVQKLGLKAKPEVGIQFGAGGATRAKELEAEGTRDAEWPIMLAKQYLAAGAQMIIQALGLVNVMFEAADPEVFAWYIKNYGPEVNLFVDHSQIVQLECLRSGIWGTASLWGRVVSYKG
jgi:phosphosulfolactate synthase (CoM biosynthesis protein A)